jgi:activator of HSP90 ATPase
MLKSPTCPDDHKATLTTALDQSPESFYSTKVSLALANIPKGLEDTIKRDLEGFYLSTVSTV